MVIHPSACVIIIDIVLISTFVDAKEHEIFQFGKVCSLRPQQIIEDSAYYVYYDGVNRAGAVWCSHIGFRAYGANSKDKFQICATVDSFHDPMCTVKVSLRNSLNGTVLRTFSCTKVLTTKFCGKQGEDLYIILDFMSSMGEEQSEFIFHVDATKTYNHIATVAGISVGVAAVCIIIVVFIVVKCRNRKGPILRNRFRNTSVSFFCQHSCCNEESHQASTVSSLTSTEIEEIEARPYTRYSNTPPAYTFSRMGMNNISLINPYISQETGVSQILVPPPPYEERGEDSMNPPSYSSLYM